LCNTAFYELFLQLEVLFMQSRLHLRLAIISIALIMANACWGADNHYAVATTANGLYLLWAEGQWSSGNSALPISLEDGGPIGSQISSVATYNDWIYLTDAGTNSLIVGKLFSPSQGNYVFRKTKSIKLTNSTLRVERPSKLATDDEGGVYVVGGTWTDGSGVIHNCYAYVNDVANNWSSGSITVNVGEVSGNALTDVAAYGSGFASQAIITHLVTGAGRQTHISISSQGSTNGGPTQIPESYNPGAVAVLTGAASDPLAYVLSRRSSFDDTNMFGTLDIVNLVTRSIVGHYELPRHMDPQDIAVVRNGTGYYLAIIGVPKNYTLDPNGNLVPDPTVEPAQAWRIELPDNGIPSESAFANPSTLIWDGTDQSGGQMIVGSQDGLVVWTAHPGMNSQVRAWTFNTWQPTSGTFTEAINGTVTGIAKLLGLPSPVPEPSSMLSFATFAAGVFVFFRRKG
jgi:hypothetical protein